MSTNGVIARAKGDAWEGVYHHSDSYPTWLGPRLWSALHSSFKNDVEAFLKHAVDQHRQGWSCYPDEPYGSDQLDMVVTSEDVDPLFHEWVYVFSPRMLTVFYHKLQTTPPKPGQPFHAFHWKNFPGGISREVEEIQGWFVLEVEGTYPLDGPEPDWRVVECGLLLEHCSHYACVHNSQVPRPDGLKSHEFGRQYHQVPYEVAMKRHKEQEAA